MFEQITQAEAASILKISSNGVKYLIKTGQLHAKKSGRIVLVNSLEIEQLQERRMLADRRKKVS